MILILWRFIPPVLSETIGDDVGQIAAKAIAEGKVPEGKHVIHASTPSYVGSHVTGFSNMCASMAKYFAGKTGYCQGTGEYPPRMGRAF